jgi:hypothetical protein
LLFGSPASLAVVRFGVVPAVGPTKWGPAVKVDAGATEVTGSVPAARSSGVAVQVLFGSVPAEKAIATIGGRQYSLDGALSSAIQTGTWRQAGTVQRFTVYVKKKGPTPIYALQGGRTGPGLTIENNQTKTETVRVHATAPTTIVRDVAWDPGWRGTVRVNGGPAQKVTVGQHGLVQEIVVPAGVDEVTFSYTPPHFLVASVLSLAGVVVSLAALVIVLVRRWRRRGMNPAMPPL